LESCEEAPEENFSLLVGWYLSSIQYGGWYLVPGAGDFTLAEGPCPLCCYRGGGGTRYTQEMGICALELFLLANTQICSKHN